MTCMIISHQCPSYLDPFSICRVRFQVKSTINCIIVVYIGVYCNTWVILLKKKKRKMWLTSFARERYEQTAKVYWTLCLVITWARYKQTFVFDFEKCLRRSSLNVSFSIERVHSRSTKIVTICFMHNFIENKWGKWSFLSP